VLGVKTGWKTPQITGGGGGRIVFALDKWHEETRPEEHLLEKQSSRVRGTTRLSIVMRRWLAGEWNRGCNRPLFFLQQ